MADLAGLLTTTPGLRLVPPSTFASSVDVLLRPGGAGEVEVTMPTQPYVDLRDRLSLIDDLSSDIFSFASMLPDDEPQIDQWLQVLDALPSTAIDDADAEAMARDVRDTFTPYRHAVQGPAPFTFTFTSRTNTLSFSLTNTTSARLHVRVRLSSPKLTFPDGDVSVVLEPDSDTEVKVRAQALSNGRSSVFLRVYTPAENSETQVMTEVVLTAQVRSLAGIGQLVTGALLLLLLAWWGRHWQQARRKRAAATNVGDTDGPDDRAADAATTSLPPS
jgi:hypothetical protein